MDGLFFGSKHSLRLQNPTRIAKKVTLTPQHFVRINVANQLKYSVLAVEILSKREPMLMSSSTTRAEFKKEVEEYFAHYFGEGHWDKMARFLTIPPKWTCIRVNPPLTREDAIAQLQALTQNLFRIAIVDSVPDCIGLEFSKPNLEILSMPTEARVIVDTGCGEAVLRGADVFAPGVLGCTAGLLADTFVSVLIDLDSVVKRGDKDDKLNSNGRRLLFIGVGVTKQSRPQMFLEQGRSGVAVAMLERPSGSSPCLNNVMDGQIFVQNLPSALVCRSLQPVPGDLVLDMCASPGGKSTHLAAMMKDNGVLVACDRSFNKLVPVRACLDKFASPQLTTFVCKTDSTKATITESNLSRASLEKRTDALLLHLRSLSSTQGVANLFPGSLPRGVFDKIVLDGPCSSLGLRPRFSHISTSLKLLAEMSLVQKRMLFNAVGLVKVGGFVSYSTCTFNPGENEHVVRWALDFFGKSLRLVPVLPRVGGPGLTSILSASEAELVQRFDPSDEKVDSIGFFIARFEKLDETVATKPWLE